MGEFFRGWQRKVGVVTLAMALVATGGWARSLIIGDEVTIRFANYAHFLSSYYGWIRWECYTIGPNTAESRFRSLASCRTQWTVDDPRTFIYSSDWRRKMDLEFEWWGVQFGTTKINAGVSSKSESIFINFCSFVTPYVFIVFPLAGLSGCLLILSPRKSTQKKLIEPVSEKVA